MKKQNSEFRSQESGPRLALLLVALVVLFTAHCSVLNAQTLKAGPRGTSAPVEQAAQTPAGVTITPAMKPDDQLRVRNLQYQKDKKLLELQNVVARYNELQASLQRDDQMIEEAVRASAKAAGVDTGKYVFDLDSLTWNARPASATNPNPQSPEVKKER
ncbi:MAG TPA: hypothetical protein VIW64_16125 [Pyrinomonadaceae bacterium]|jgi:endonuclease/exonuclease/phosphatase (EEP) superfamily protein YafD